MQNSQNQNHLQSFIKKLLRDQDVNDVRSALIRSWAKVNKIPYTKIDKSPIIQEFLDFGTPTVTGELEDRILRKSKSISIKQLEGCFESFLEKGHRKSQGAVYTPNYIIDYLLKHGLKIRPGDQAKQPRICDPACGSGGFLIRAAKLMNAQQNIS